MDWLRIVAILLIFDAVVVLFRPDFIRKFAALLCRGPRIYITAIIKAVIGTVFLFGVSDSNQIPQVILVFGILAIGCAVFIVALPQKARAITNWFVTRNDFTLRVFAIIYLLIAALLVYSA